MKICLMEMDNIVTQRSLYSAAAAAAEAEQENLNSNLLESSSGNEEERGQTSSISFGTVSDSYVAQEVGRLFVFRIILSTNKN